MFEDKLVGVRGIGASARDSRIKRRSSQVGVGKVSRVPNLRPRRSAKGHKLVGQGDGDDDERRIGREQCGE